MCGTRPGQLAQNRHQVRLRGPLSDLAQRRIDQGGVEHHRPVGGDDHRPAPERAGLAALVALQQPRPDRRDDVVRGALPAQLFGDPPARAARARCRRSRRCG